MEPHCRLCAKTTLDFVNILDDYTLSTRLQRLFQLEISVDDKLPTIACQLCCDTVNRTWAFSEHIQQSQLLLRNLAVTKNTAKIEDESPPTVLSWETYPWLCSECKCQTSSVTDLRDHYRHYHPTLTPIQYSCAHCPKTYLKYHIFIAHIKSTHFANLELQCELCYKWFKTLDTVQRHRKRQHHNSGKVSLVGDDSLYLCQTCGKAFTLNSALQLHIRCHLPDELKFRYACDQCPKRFVSKPNLFAHKRIHAGVREFTCDQCGKSFVQKGNLDNHLLTHNTDRPYACAQCGKRFKTSVRLRKHCAVHTDLKPHRCEVCGRQFRERGTLKEHQRIHTGAMPFKCEFCGRQFRFKGILTTHIRQHTGERPYSCNDCQHHFTNWPNYNKHMMRRHGINTSVTVRKPQRIPPTGQPNRNPPGTILAPPQPVLSNSGSVAVTDDHPYHNQHDHIAANNAQFYPVFNL